MGTKAGPSGSQIDTFKTIGKSQRGFDFWKGNDAFETGVVFNGEAAIGLAAGGVTENLDNDDGAVLEIVSA